MMNIGGAVRELKHGVCVAREAWGRDGRFLFLLPAATVPLANIHTEPLRSIAEANGGTVECLPAIRLHTADGKVLTGWMPGVEDLLAEDWLAV